MALFAVPGGPSKKAFSRASNPIPNRSIISFLPTKVSLICFKTAFNLAVAFIILLLFF
ncbi:hypothetical protein D3C86_1931160 [compost metagenome]